MHYKATGHGNRNFTISNEQMGTIGQLEYEVWFPNKATATIGDQQAYRFEPTGFWQTAIAITRQEAPYATLETKWGDGLVLSFETGQSLLFKRKGFFSGDHVLLDEAGNELASITADFNWSHLNFDYEIEAADHWLNHETLVALPFLLTYCMRYQRVRHAAVA